MEKITNNIYKLNVDSNVYLLKDLSTVIDTGPPNYKDIVKKEISKITDLKDIKKVILTHLHYDHLGNFDIFPNAEFFASEQEIKDFKNSKEAAILNPELAERFTKQLKPLKDFNGFKILNTPGHTRGSICIYYEKEKILFTGDTLFNNGFGRTDLPTSDPDKMEATLKFVKNIDYKILCPGHDY